MSTLLPVVSEHEMQDADRRGESLAELFAGATVSGDCKTDTVTSLCCDPATKVCGIPALAFGKR